MTLFASLAMVVVVVVNCQRKWRSGQHLFSQMRYVTTTCSSLIPRTLPAPVFAVASLLGLSCCWTQSLIACSGLTPGPFCCWIQPLIACSSLTPGPLPVPVFDSLLCSQAFLTSSFVADQNWRQVDLQHAEHWGTVSMRYY